MNSNESEILVADHFGYLEYEGKQFPTAVLPDRRRIISDLWIMTVLGIK